MSVIIARIIIECRGERMKKKVILITVDGMRPDALFACGSPYTERLMKMGSYTLSAKSVYPSGTLPAHASVFHSAHPEAHGVVCNFYMTPKRETTSLCRVIKESGGKCAAYYSWEPLRDITRPEELDVSFYLRGGIVASSDTVLAERMLRDIEELSCKFDFCFLHLGECDGEGHFYGWMSENYLNCLRGALESVMKIIDRLGKDYTVILTADHGGHDRRHGTDLDEDMTVPMFFIGEDFVGGCELSLPISLLDIAPTVASIMGLEKCAEWQGKSLLGELK